MVTNYLPDILIRFECAIPCWFDVEHGERVGLLVGGWEDDQAMVRHVIPVRNTRGSKATDFGVSERDFERISKRFAPMGQQVVGVMHSHPLGAFLGPTATDYEGLPWEWVGMVHCVEDQSNHGYYQGHEVLVRENRG